jgi:hypothetical protein
VCGTHLAHIHSTIGGKSLGPLVKAQSSSHDRVAAMPRNYDRRRLATRSR